MKNIELVLQSNDAEQTEAVAASIGARLRGGEVLELVSDLGGGKTTFTRGLARAAGSTDVVASPTFTISKVYKTDSFAIHHFDFYRLQSAGLASHEVEDLLGDPSVVLVVEWGGIVEDVLPENKLTVQLRRTTDTAREITISYPENLTYLLEEYADTNA